MNRNIPNQQQSDYRKPGLVTIGVCAESPDVLPRVQELCEQLSLPICDVTSAVDLDFLLTVTAERLELRWSEKGSPGPVYVDFVSGRMAHRRQFGGGHRSPFGKALGIKGSARPTIIDATAGLGRDAFVAASWGCTVQMIERSSLIAALLADGLQRAGDDAEIGDWIGQRLKLYSGDAIQMLSQWPTDERPEVIYLDPMYPGRSKSALVKKEMRLFQRIVGSDPDAGALLNAARDCALRRVVVKRPGRAAFIADKKPSFSTTSKNTRYDVYLLSE